MMQIAMHRPLGGMGTGQPGRRPPVDHVPVSPGCELMASIRFGGKLHEAAHRPEQLQHLLGQGIYPVDEVLAETGDTALHRVLKKENPNLRSLQLLLDADADVNLKNRRGETALHCLMDHETPSLKALNLLLDAGAGVNKRDRAGYTPLHTYLIYPRQNTQILERLLEAGTDPNAPNRDGMTPLHRVLTQETPNLESARVLLEGGAKIKHAQDGRLLLTTALKARDAGLLLAILQSGFQLHKKDKSKHSVPARLLGDATNQGLLRRFLGKRTEAFIFKVLTQEVVPDMEAILDHTGQSGNPVKMAKAVAKTAFDVYA